MWWMMVYAKTRELPSLLLLPQASLYRLQLDLDFNYAVAKIFYLYLIN